LVVTVGKALTVTLVTQNLGETAFTISQALHTYFQIGDIQQVQVLGLDGTTYLDKTDGGTEKPQVGAVTIGQEVDRVYLGVSAAELAIVDAQLNRQISIQSQGSKTAIVWNPWVEIAKSMADLADEDYRQFICVETANAANDLVTIAPGGEAQLVVVYKLG
jgi:glucose-6-phosphate 1-epimerase